MNTAHSLPWQHVHFIGAGGVGMTGLALIVHDLGGMISGSDSVESRNLALLRRRCNAFAAGHDAAHLTQPDLVVASAAIPEDNPELRAARERGYPILRRGSFLAELARCFPTVVSVAGSHGKTTVTAMIAHILRQAGVRPGFLVGGDLVAGGVPAGAGDGEILVTEVDESDASQAQMRSTHAVVVNVDDDHCWSVGGEAALHACFRSFAERSDWLVAWDSTTTRTLFGNHPDCRFITAGDVPREPALRVPGWHNRVDAALAVRLAAELGQHADDAWLALASFPGVQRRLTLRYRGGGIRVIEDYAHHPAELRASLEALRSSFPQGRLRVVFQPHRFERVARYASAFAEELSVADEVVVTEPFSAWLNDAALADPRAIADAVSGPPARYSTEPYEQLAESLAGDACPGDIIAVIGAGTITRLVSPLVACLRRRDAATTPV